MLASRLRCHFCSARSQHAKTTRQFQCTACEALNFFDGKGNVVDTPAEVASNPTYAETGSTSRLASTTPLPETLNHQQKHVFCRTCIQNQLLYTQALANYLPDEDSPLYRQAEIRLPQYKAELEKRYPQVCKSCAPAAQRIINRADYYSKIQFMSNLTSANKARRAKPEVRTRDNYTKAAMRTLLNLVHCVSLACLLSQVLFHVYGALLNALPDTYVNQRSSEMPFDPSVRDCAKRAGALCFDDKCFERFNPYMSKGILLALSLIWFNPGLKAWFHHTTRIEAVKGQKQYLCMQVLIVAIRYVAWYNLTDEHIASRLNQKQLAAFHISAMLFICVFQVIGSQGIRPVAWRMKGSMMPRPEDRDVLGAMAGPGHESYVPQASEKDPWRYLKKREYGPFDINSLAPRTKPQPKSRPSWSDLQCPSPEDTAESDMDDDDAMEIDSTPTTASSFNLRPQSSINQLRIRNQFNGSQPAGWSSVRGELFGIQDQMRVDEQLRQETVAKSPQPKSPFQGKLPPAPMSMERRLRNPVVVPVPPPKVPLSQQKDFFAQMGKGVRPATFPEKGSNLELRKSAWTLPGDVRETGLEDLMSGNKFRINDEPTTSPVKTTIGWFSSLLGRTD